MSCIQEAQIPFLAPTFRTTVYGEGEENSFDLTYFNYICHLEEQLLFSEDNKLKTKLWASLLSILSRKGGTSP